LKIHLEVNKEAYGITMDKNNIGLIGLGKMGLLHMGILKNIPNCDVVAVAEENKIILSVLKKYMPNLAVYKEYHEMLDSEQLDTIYITTPVYLHKEMILESMKHHLNIFVEKPLAMTGAECQEIVTKDFDKKTMVGYVRRFDGTYNFVKTIIDTNELGSIQQISSQLFVSEVMSKGNGWKYQKEKSGGGVLIDLGCHAIDLFHFLLGDITEVHAYGQSIFTTVEDDVHINMKFSKGYVGSFHLSWSKRGYRLPEFKIAIQLEKGDIEVTEKYIKIFSEIDTKSLKKGMNIFYQQHLSKPVPINIGGADFTLEDMHFIDCIQRDVETIENFEEASKVNLVIDKIYSSMNDQRIEKIDYKVI
jgi:predicted dehydrogenase